MSNPEETVEGKAETEAPPKATQARYDWNDPTVPAGNAPPSFPRWPMVIAGFAWLCWLGFLIVMAIDRYAGSSS